MVVDYILHAACYQRNPLGNTWTGKSQDPNTMGTNRLWTAIHPHQEIFNSCTCSNVSKISFIFVWFEDLFSLGQSQVNEGSDFTNKFVFCLRRLDHKNHLMSFWTFLSRLKLWQRFFRIVCFFLNISCVLLTYAIGGSPSSNKMSKYLWIY